MHPRIARGLYFGLQRLRGEPVARALREVRRTRFASRQALSALQAQRQIEQLRWVIRHVPYYERRYAAHRQRIERGGTPEDVRTLMEALPVLTRTEVEGFQADLEARPTRALRTHPDRTSGSSGTPLVFPCDQVAWAYRHALAFRCMEDFGVRIGEPYAYVFGQHWGSLSRRRLALRDWVLNRQRISAFEIHPDKIDEHLRLLLRSRPTHILGYPSAVYDLCVQLHARGLDQLQGLELKALFLTAEPLRPHQRAVIEEVTASRCVDMYGSAEGGQNAHECPAGSLHLQAEATWVQLQDPHVETGDALVTDMFLRAFPMVRYAIGDEIRLRSGTCECGRPHPMLASIEGRSGEPIVLPNGREVNANLPSYIFKSIARHGALRRYRFVHTDDDRLELYLVVTPEFSDEHRQTVESETRAAFGNDIPLSVRLVDELPHLPNAKHRDYIRAGGSA